MAKRYFEAKKNKKDYVVPDSAENKCIGKNEKEEFEEYAMKCHNELVDIGMIKKKEKKEKKERKPRKKKDYNENGTFSDRGEGKRMRKTKGLENYKSVGELMGESNSVEEFNTKMAEQNKKNLEMLKKIMIEEHLSGLR